MSVIQSMGGFFIVLDDVIGIDEFSCLTYLKKSLLKQFTRKMPLYKKTENGESRENSSARLSTKNTTDY